MPNVLHTMSDLFESYKKWVSANPQTVGDLETTLKWASYFVSGRISSSPVISELTYSLSNLIVLFNDQIITNSLSSSIPHHRPAGTKQQDGIHLVNKHRLKLWLTTLEYCEVFIEMTARQVWGDAGRWFFIFVVQTVKCIFRLLLTLKCREDIVRTPAIKVLNRRDVGKSLANEDGESEDPKGEPNAFGANVNASFELRRSGKIVRCVEGAPPIHLRSWKAPRRQLTAAERLLEKQQSKRLTLAECVYIFKPLVHLGSCGLFGLNSWKSYGVPLILDVYSLHLYNRKRDSLSQQQKLELSRRTVQMLMYLVRSPFYENYTRTRLATLIEGIGNVVPLTGPISAALNEYIPHWQSIYFYMWSS